MSPVENLAAHREEDWAISVMADHIREEFAADIAPKNRPYFVAAMSAIAHNPGGYRRGGYSCANLRYYDHQSDVKGKLLRCKARFDEEGSDAQ